MRLLLVGTQAMPLAQRWLLARQVVDSGQMSWPSKGSIDRMLEQHSKDLECCFRLLRLADRSLEPVELLAVRLEPFD